jgi:translation initiation factor IF-2
VPKRRVYEVAKQFGLSSEAMVKLLSEIGVTVKSHMSSIEDATVQRVQEKFAREKEEEKRKDELKKSKFSPPQKRPPDIIKIASKKPLRFKPKKKQKLEVTDEMLRSLLERDTTRKKKRRRQIDQKLIEGNIKKTLAIMERGTRKRKRRKILTPDAAEQPAEVVPIVKVNEFISVAELSPLISAPPNEIISSLMELGVMVTINQRLDFDTISLICEEFGYKAELSDEYAVTEPSVTEDRPEDLVSRPPVCTIMGHVDHGKTSLLDFIRKSNIIAGERGGITQHIGAYEVVLPQGRITFLDTPGHVAFSAMRARGAQVTDIVILVVAADDRVMPQTLEAIDHARAAGVPMVVAINKIDLPAANVDRVKRELAQHGVLVEDYGGDILSAEISAKFGTGIERLLELLLLQAEMLELKANPSKPAAGVVIESRLDKGMGAVATLLITSGTLKVHDSFICGLYSGKVRSMLNERNQVITLAPPSAPVQVLGFAGVPQAGDKFLVMRDERAVREISQVRRRLKREQDFRRVKRMDLSQLYERIKRGQTKTLELIIKGDVDGSVEALSDALTALSRDEVSVDVIHKGVGRITESDILLAAASEAIVIGFQVKPDVGGRIAAAREGIDVRLYDIVYEAISDVKNAMEGLLEPKENEIFIGLVEVREVFAIPKLGTVAGSFVKEGLISRDAHVRLLRGQEVLYSGKVSSLKRFKDDVKEVISGLECGIMLEGWNDVAPGDVIEVFRIQMERRTLS